MEKKTVVQYSETFGYEKYLKFINQPFSINNLHLEPIYFKDWRYKNMGEWVKLTNDNNIVLEFYPTQYNIIIPKSNKITLSLPLTINDFINDMCRNNVQLYWSNWMDINFEPKEYLHKDKIRTYFENMLEIMEKSYELMK